MANSIGLARFARRLRIAAIGGAIAVPAAALLAALAPRGVARVDPGVLPLGWGIGVAAVSSLLVAAALLALARMLAAVERGETFSPAATRPFRRFACFLLLAALAETLLPPLVQLGLILFAGRRTFVLSLSDGEFLALLTALVLFLVAHLFDEAARLEEDSRSIV